MSKIDQLQNAVIHVLDAGRFKRKGGVVTKANFGCARLDRHSGELTTGQDLDVHAEQIASDLDANRPVFYLVEATLFLPNDPDWRQIFRCREGERMGGGRNYSWSAPPGGSALLSALAELPWVLKRVGEMAKMKHQGYSSLPEFLAAGAGIVILEAMIVSASGTANGELKESELAKIAAIADPHQRDAAAGALVADRLLREPTSLCPVIREAGDVFSLAAAALMYAGLSDDITAMRKPTHVIFARKPIAV